MGSGYGFQNWDYIALLSCLCDYGSFMATAATAATTTKYELTRRKSQLPYVIVFAKLEKIQVYYAVCLQPIIFFVLVWCF
jgi:hypothetical protein